jgi:hypothetical protein
MLYKGEEPLELVMVLDQEPLQHALEQRLADLELQRHVQVLLLQGLEQQLDHLDLQDQIPLGDHLIIALEIIALTDRRLRT